MSNVCSLIKKKMMLHVTRTTESCTLVGHKIFVMVDSHLQPSAVKVDLESGKRVFSDVRCVSSLKPPALK